MLSFCFGLHYGGSRRAHALKNYARTEEMMDEKPQPIVPRGAFSVMHKRNSKLDSPEVRRAFLKVLAETGRPTEAALSVGLTSTTVDHYAALYPVFRQEIQEARAIYRDFVVNRAVEQRAIHGWEEPVFFKGGKVGTIRRYSDRLLELWAKKHDPEYGTSTVTVQNPDGSALAGGAGNNTLINTMIVNLTNSGDDKGLADLERLLASQVDSPPDMSLEEVPALVTARRTSLPGGPTLAPHERAPLLLEAQAEVNAEEAALAKELEPFDGEPLFSAMELEAKRQAADVKYFDTQEHEHDKGDDD